MTRSFSSSATPEVSTPASAAAPPPARRASESERVLLREQGEAEGPAFLAVGGLHGNEPSGVEAIRRIAQYLEPVREEHGYALCKGDFLGLAGNLRALQSRQRFLHHDLNRGWSMEHLVNIVEKGPKSPEDHEMLDLFSLIQDFRGRARGPLSFVDLHSTSGESPPFASVSNRRANCEMAEAIPVPTVLGIDTHLAGTFLECMEHFEFVGIVFEGGQHDDARAVDHNEAAIWMLLETLELVEASLGEAIEQRLRWAHATLEPIGASLPKRLQIKTRYALESTARFRMCPGYESFQPVEEGELLAMHKGREVRSQRDGRILMPLYQMQGDEGFFIMTEV